MRKLHPSSANRWLNCPGSIVLCEELPDELRQQGTSEAAERGTAIHAASEEILRGLPFREAVGKYGLDAEARQEAQFYTETVLGWMPAEGNPFGIEEKVTLTYGDYILSGIVDFFAFDGEVLRIVDLKTGTHEVLAENNDQLRCYAVALLEKYRLHAGKVLLTIVQRGKIRECLVSAAELTAHKARIKDVVAALSDGVAGFDPGTHCRWCPAVIVCDAARDNSAKEAQEEFSPISAQQISERLYAVENVLAPYVAAVRDAARTLLRTHRVPGWRLAPVRRRVWHHENKPESVVRWLSGRKVRIGDLVRAMTPAQVERVVQTRLPDAFVDLVEISSAVRADDGREFSAKKER